MSDLKKLWRLRRPDFVIVGAVLALLAISPLARQITEARWWLDLTWQTPFYGVRAQSQAEGDVLAVEGSMVKRRCVFLRLSGYVIGQDGVARRVPVITALEGSPRGNRPASPNAQAWGPWVLTSPVPDPTAWQIYAHHECPEGRRVTLFARGPWR